MPGKNKNDITERQKNILVKVVKEHIKNAVPISSSYIKDKYNMGISSATIRLDFSELTDKGYLEKNYISGGRIPTDKGYRFFIENRLIGQEKKNNFLKNKKAEKQFEEIIKNIRNGIRLEKEIAKTMAKFSLNLSAVFNEELGLMVADGWKEVMEAPEFCYPDYFRKFTDFVDKLEGNIEKLLSFENELGFRAYVGREVPLAEDWFSVIVSKKINLGGESVVAIIGPKRMDFGKNFSLINQLINIVGD